MLRYPKIRYNVLSFFNTKEMRIWFCAELFFVIGGFFLFKRLQSHINVWDLIKKLYVRLTPALAFTFALCCIGGTVDFHRFPSILSLSTGLSIPDEVMHWGDWYVGVYFWCSLLFIGLFYNNLRWGFVWAVILCYLALCLRFNAHYDGWMKTYYTVIGTAFIRGIHGMGIGIFAAFLSDKINIVKKKSVSIFFTVLEIYFLWTIFYWLLRTPHSHLNFLEIEILFALLLICIVHSLGYLTKYLNKIKNIQLISRYAYPVMLGHIPVLKFLEMHKNYAQNGLACGLIIGGGILIGILEYHLVEQKIVPWVKKFFKC